MSEKEMRGAFWHPGGAGAGKPGVFIDDCKETDKAGGNT